MKIEVGEYVRTKNGYITKIVDYLGKDTVMKMKHYEIDRYLPQNGFLLYDNDIKAHSKNIIDLIEVRRLCEWE